MKSSALKNQNNEFKYNYHSLKREDRHRDLKALAELNTVEATRELISIFNCSQWRETKLFIVENLIHCENLRCLEFLISITQNENQDIPLATAALQALGILGGKSLVGAQKYLISFYTFGEQTLRAACVRALVKSHSRDMAEKFVFDLVRAQREEKYAWLKSLIYAVGELKCVEAQSSLQQLVINEKSRDIKLAALVALGKITRRPEDITQFESEFVNDAFEYQIYENTRAQVNTRAHWRAEDYLQKIFSGVEYHPAMPLELNTFAENDIRAGVEIFADAQHQHALFDVLAKLHFKNLPKWYPDIVKSVGEIDVESFERALISHFSDGFSEMIYARKNIAHESWWREVVYTLPSADKLFTEVFKSDEYHKLSNTDKITILNFYHVLGLMHFPDKKYLQSFEKQMEQLLLAEAHPEVQARVIRLTAQLGFFGSKTQQFIRQNFLKKEVTGSALFFCELYAEKHEGSFVEEVLRLSLQSDLIAQNFKLQIVRVLTAMRDIKHTDLEKYVEGFLPRVSSLELARHLVQLSARHQWPELRQWARGFLNEKAEVVLQLEAVIAAKSYHDENLTEDLALLLRSPVDSIRGRVLDTLLSQPGLRAKRLVFDDMVLNLQHEEVVENVCRKLDLSDLQSEYFYKTLSTALPKVHNDFPLKAELQDLCDRLHASFQLEKQSSKMAYPTDSDVYIMDLELSQKIKDYEHFDESAKLAFRSAELPFFHPEVYGDFVDKSSSILGYSKALDIIFDKQFGRRFLMSKLENRLHEFQNVIHVLELIDSLPPAERVLKNLALEKYFNVQSLPVHKMYLIGQAILSGKIIHEQAKVLDGLRAWGVILLLFSRKTNLTQKPLIPVSLNDSEVVELAQKLMWFQDLRNPVAHRQTLSDIKSLEEARQEAVKVLNLLQRLIKS